MIVCRGCGTENPEGESFCVSCGSFLEFSGEKIEEPKPPPRPRPVVAPPRPTPTPPPAPSAAAPPPPAEAPPRRAAAPEPPQPPEPPEPPKSSKGRITFTSPRPSSASPPPPTASAPPSPSATSQTPAAPSDNAGPAVAPPPTAGKAPPAMPPPPPVRVPESEDGKPVGATTTPAPAAPPAEAPATPPADATVAEAPAEAATEAPPPPEATKEMDERARALVTRPTAVTPTVIRAGPQRPAAPSSSGPGMGAMQPRAPEARQPSAQQPSAVKPKQAPVKPPKAKAKQYRPGDLYCGKCGEGNPPTRKFCQKCGESLAQAQVVAEPPWWKRIFKKEKKVYKAGERGKNYDGSPSGARRGVLRAKKVFRWIVIIVAILFLIAILGPWKDSFNAKRESVTRKVKGFFVATYEPLHADGAQATTSKAENPPGLAIDGTTNQGWLENVQGDGEGQTLIVTFQEQVNIDRIGFRIGASDEQEEFLAQPRPRVLHLVFSNGTTQDITVKDTPDFQHFQVKGKASVRVEITIVSVNPSAKGGHDTGIAEVEFFKKT